MTPQAIRDGFEQLRSDKQMLGLADAARCRSEADWLVGINGTRAMTAFNSRDGGFFLTTVGRVQTPTLSIVVEREEKIRKFVSRDYWEVHATFRAEAGEYEGKWFDPKWKKNAGRRRELNAPTASGTSARRRRSPTPCAASRPPSPRNPSRAPRRRPLLFDLTSLQREANGRFGFSAKTTLSIAQALYEKHKVLTYPRTDSRALPEDYLPVVKDTFEMLADERHARHLRAARARRPALKDGYVKPTKRIFDNAKVSRPLRDHPDAAGAEAACPSRAEALRPGRQAASWRCSSRSAEFLVTTRISPRSVGSTASRPRQGAGQARAGSRSTARKRRTRTPTDRRTWCRSSPARWCAPKRSTSKALKTRPPARYTEATLLGAMEGAGKLIDDDELREAMQEKGLGTPATRAAIIEGLINEKYMLREGRELIPTAKAFQLMTLLRGLGVEELTQARADRRLGIQARRRWSTASSVARGLHARDRRDDRAHRQEGQGIRPRHHARATTPRSKTPCPNCGGVVKENYRRYTCTGTAGAGPRPAASRSARSPAAARSSWPRSSSSCATSRSARSRASARRRAGRSPPRSCSSTTRTRQELEARVRLRRSDSRRRDRRAGRLLRPGAARPVPEVRRPRLRARQQLRLRARGAAPTRSPSRRCDFKSRQDHPAAAGRRASR